MTYVRWHEPTREYRAVRPRIKPGYVVVYLAMAAGSLGVWGMIIWMIWRMC